VSAAPNAITWPVNIGGAKARITVELDAAGRPCGISTAGLGLPGSALDGLWRCFVKTWDVNLRSGRVPLATLATFLGRSDEMAGPTGDELVVEAGGPADAFAKTVLVRTGHEELVAPALVRAAGEAGACGGE
jgi:hypothetical protein